MQDSLHMTAWLDGPRAADLGVSPIPPDADGNGAPNDPQRTILPAILNLTSVSVEQQGGENAGPNPGKPRRKRATAPKLPDPDDMTDVWHARRFVDLYGDRLRYCPAWGKWLEYDGQRWRKDNTLAPQRLARESVQILRQQLARIKGRSEREDYGVAVRRAESIRAITAIVRLAQSDERIVVKPEEFDADRFLLNCRNGTLDLRTEQLRPHDPGDCLTKLAPVNFVPGASCPTWDAFLHRVMAGDDELIGYVRRAAGYALTGDVSGQCLFLLYGQGRNGKTVLLNALLHVLGDYGMTAPNHLLTSAGRQQHATALADLDGMRFVAISEPSGGRFDEELVKLLTGGDAIRAHRMHCDHFEFSPSHKFFMSSNRMPEVRETGIAIWRRLRLIVFSVTIPPHEEDRLLPAKLREEAPGILCWMLKGCLDWQEKGLAPPGKVRRDTMDYREQMDPLSDFITACCEVGPDKSVQASTLRTAYERWCDREGKSLADCIRNNTQFGTLLTQKGFAPKHTNKGNVRIGIALKPSSSRLPVQSSAEGRREGSPHGVEEGELPAPTGDWADEQEVTGT